MSGRQKRSYSFLAGTGSHHYNSFALTYYKYLRFEVEIISSELRLIGEDTVAK